MVYWVGGLHGDEDTQKRAEMAIAYWENDRAVFA